jgi:hypothetical protein
MALSLPGVIALAYGEHDKDSKTSKAREQNNGPNVNAQEKGVNMHAQE